MAGTTDFVGVRVFSDLRSTVAKIDTRDSTVIGLAGPAPNANNSQFPIGEPVRISTDDPDQVGDLGTGIMQDTIAQLAAEGIVADIAYVRTQHSVLTDPAAKLTAEINAIAGNAGLKTGAWALLDAKDHIGLEPGILLAPGYTLQRTGNVANPVAVALAAIGAKIIDCLAFVDAPATSRADASTYASDFAAALNVVAFYPNVICNFGSGNLVRPMSVSAAAATVRRDKQAGNPYKAAWNRELEGILGPSQRVNYIDGEITSDANWLNQHGLGTVIEKRLLWAPYTTATDPTVSAWRSIKRIRTRRAIEKAMLAPMRQYLSEDLTPHTVSLIYRALDQFLGDLAALGALVDYELLWSKSLNPASLLEAGAMRVKARFAETPDLADLQIYTEPQPEAFDVLEAAIASALSQLGLANVRVTA